MMDMIEAEMLLVIVCVIVSCGIGYIAEVIARRDRV